MEALFGFFLLFGWLTFLVAILHASCPSSPQCS
jgi:hypothetical protein